MTKRLSLTLEPDDVTTVDAFTTDGTPEQDALIAWARDHGLYVRGSDASLLRVLIRAGAETLREQVLADGYAELAATMNSPEAREENRLMRERYAARVEPLYAEDNHPDDRPAAR